MQDSYYLHLGRVIFSLCEDSHSFNWMLHVQLDTFISLSKLSAMPSDLLWKSNYPHLTLNINSKKRRNTKYTSPHGDFRPKIES